MSRWSWSPTGLTGLKDGWEMEGTGTDPMCCLNKSKKGAQVQSRKFGSEMLG